MYNMYHENGVIVTPNVVMEGDNLTVAYKGILCNSGADEVYMHVGFGEQWKYMKDIRMSRKSDSFEASLPVTSHDSLNIVFKDSAGNWDNNSGRNYTFEVQVNKGGM